MTDEQLVLYLDTAVDRRRAESEADFVRAVEVTRIGTIFAHDGKQYNRWRRTAGSKADRPRGMKGEQLEQMIALFAATNPEYIVHGARS